MHYCLYIGFFLMNLLLLRWGVYKLVCEFKYADDEYPILVGSNFQVSVVDDFN